MPNDHTINITPYYLLGLIEGEGSFAFAKNKQLQFVLVLTQSQKPLLDAIKKFIDELSVDIKNPLPFTIDRCNVNHRKIVGDGAAPLYYKFRIFTLFTIILSLF